MPFVDTPLTDAVLVAVSDAWSVECGRAGELAWAAWELGDGLRSDHLEYHARQVAVFNQLTPPT